MAIVTETYELNGHMFVRTYSDSGRYVVGGNPPGAYTEANDPAELNRQYTEGEYLPAEELAAMLRDKASAYDILVGVGE